MKPQPTASDGSLALGRADIRAQLSELSIDERFAIHRRWTARYLPIWFAAYPRYAEAAGLGAEKRELQEQRVRELLQRADALRAGERVVKARVNETESAISALSYQALNYFVEQPWPSRIRSAALALRAHLRFPAVRDDLENLAHDVYLWAEIETGFPGDSSALLQFLTPEERHSHGPGHFDGHHLLYHRPARLHGLEAEGKSVYDEVAAIMARIDDDPGPYPIAEAFWG